MLTPNLGRKWILGRSSSISGEIRSSKHSGMRRCRLEPLEARMLLSLTVASGDSYEALVAAIESSPTMTQMPEFIRVDSFDHGGSGETDPRFRGHDTYLWGTRGTSL